MSSATIIVVAAFIAQSAEVTAPPSNVPAVRGVRTPEVTRDAILAKLDYDLSYFRRVQRLNARGKLPEGVSADVFKTEVRRAEVYVPALRKLLEQKRAYLAGSPIEQPGATERFRVYDNLVGLLNMVQATSKGAVDVVLAYGERVTIRTVDDLGVRRKAEPKYRLELLREYFYMMGAACFRMSRDDEAVAWFEKIEKDPDLRALRQQVDAPEMSPEDRRLERLSRLRLSAIAVMPLSNLRGLEEIGWIERGAMEVLSSDLAQYTDLAVVERAQIDKIVGEYRLQYVLDGRQEHLDRLEQLLGAGSLLIGSYRPVDGGGIELILRLVDAKEGIILAVGSGVAPEDDLLSKSREVLISMLEGIGWVDAIAVTELRSARVPDRGVIRDLVAARKLLSTEEAEARRLYAKALKSDPTYAGLFEELKQEFPEEAARVAVLPFVNVTEAQEHEWLVRAVNQALESDLPELGFSIVERTQLDQVLRAYFTSTASTTNDLEQGREIAENVRADFVVLGAILSKKAMLRIDARMVEVKSGEILFSATVSGAEDDLMNILTELSEGIARSANHSLSEDVMGELIGRRLSRAELEKQAREEVKRRHLVRRDEVKADRLAEAEARRENELNALHVAIQFSTTPTTATIYVNGSTVGVGHVFVDDVVGGHVRVRVEADGYHPHEELRLFALGDFISRKGEPFSFHTELEEILWPISPGILAGAWTEPRLVGDGVGFAGEIFFDIVRVIQVGVGIGLPRIAFTNLRVVLGTRNFDVGIFGHAAMFDRASQVDLKERVTGHALGGGLTMALSFPTPAGVYGVRAEGGPVWDLETSELAYPIRLSGFLRFE